jgi:hypothetical protein
MLQISRLMQQQKVQSKIEGNNLGLLMSLKSTCANLTDNNTIVIVSFRSYPFGGIIFASFLALYLWCN